MTRRFGWALAALALAGCDGQLKTKVVDGWVRLPANPGAPAAAYFTVTAGPVADTLTGVTTGAAAKAEMHESMAHGAMSSMVSLPSVTVPAGGAVAFAPGGRHVMLFGVKPEVKPGGKLSMTFAFAHDPNLTAPLKVVGPGDPAPY